MTAAEKQLRLDCGLTFSSSHGAQVLAWLANTYNMFAGHTVGDPILMAYQEGQRSVVLELIRLAAANPETRKQQILEELKNG